MPKTDPLKSEGARAERKAVRAYVRRQIRDVNSLEGVGVGLAVETLEKVLSWVLTREKRYARRQGGL